jgi:arylsulfatase A-like enzyme
MDVHSPYNPPSKNVRNIIGSDMDIKQRNFLNNEIWDNPQNYTISGTILENIKILYDAEVNYVDSFLNQIFSIIRNKFKNDCLVIITADHGESFYEHGSFFHQGTIYDELLKIPLFIIEIGKNHLVKSAESIVQLIDIAPTILDYYDISIPESFQGKSLLPLLKRDFLDRDACVISETYQKDGIMKRDGETGYKLISIRSDEWKYIYNEQFDEELLFHLKSDPEEKVNLITKEKVKLAQLRRIRDSHFAEITAVDEFSKISKAISQIDFKNINL